MPDDAQFATYARLLRLSPIGDPVLPQLETAAVEPVAHAPAPKRRVWEYPSFLVIVILPFCLAVGYFTLFAANRYESEAKIVVRAAYGAVSSDPAATMAGSPGVGRTVDDGFIVEEYLASRDALKWLQQHAQLASAYARPKWDFVWRFPNFHSKSEEGLFAHYRRMMSAEYDILTGIVLIKVQAFTPGDAQRLTYSLMGAAEDLVNHLNQRAQDDAIALVQHEVDQMRHRAEAAQAALTEFRERELMIDPSHATAGVLDTIGRLAYELAQLNVQLTQVTQLSANSPQINSLQQRRSAVEEQIAVERRQLAGSAKAIAPRIAEYERLSLERDFSDKALVAAMAALETTRVAAVRHRIYLEPVTVPSLPDYPAYPWRIIWCAVTLLVGYMVWRMWRFTINVILYHDEL
jgi:capsular polysaccharide transport system permease protein